MKKVYFLFLVCLTITVSQAQTVIYSYGFEDGVPHNQANLVAGWTYNNGTWNTSNGWFAAANDIIYDVNYNSTTVNPHTGTEMANFNSFTVSNNKTAYIISPAINLCGISNVSISFWMFRDNGYVGDYDSIAVYINTNIAIANAVPLGTVARYNNYAIPSTASANTWNQYTFTVPAAYNGQTVYIAFKGTSKFGNDCLIDDFSIQGTQAVSVSPTSNGPICPSTPLALSANGIGTSTYSWTGPGGFTSNLANPIINPPAPAGIYSLTATGAGCTESDTTTVSVLTGPSPISVSPSVTSVCGGVAVALTATGGTLPSNDTVFYQDFNSGIVSWFADTSQSSTNGSGLGAWQIQLDGWTDGIQPALHSPDLTPFYVACANCAGAGDTWVKTISYPTFSLLGLPSATLTYNDYYRGLAGNDLTVKVDLSTDGTSWTTVKTYTLGTSVGTATAWATETVNLTPYVGNPAIFLRFNYSSNNGWYWAIDNVAVYGPGTTQQPITWEPASGLSCNTCLNPIVTPTATTTYSAVATYAATGCVSTGTSFITVNPAPTASLTPGGNTITGCGTSQPITVSTNVGSPVYQWYVPGYPITGATAATYTAPANGSYYVNVRDPSTGCSGNSQVVTVNFNPIPSASISPAGPTSACGGSITLTANTDIGNVYQWNNVSGPIAGATNAMYSVTVSGSYNVTIWQYGVACNSTSPTAVITIHPIPAASVDPVDTVSACGSQVLTAVTDIGNTYQWYASSGMIPGATNSTYMATASDLYSVKVGVNSSGCSLISGQTDVTIKTAPTASITTPSNATSACTGLTMTANTNLGTLYQWYNSLGAITNATSSTYAVSNTDNYYVAITYTTTGCTTNSATDHISINPFPVASITAPGATTVCEGSNVLFVANTGSGITYQWLENGVIQIGNILNSYSATAAGSYQVIEQAGYNCADTSNVLTMSTYPNPSASVIPDGATTFCNGGSVALYANASPGVTYQWLLNSINILTGTTDTINAASDGAYTVKVTSGNNCSYISPAVTVTVHTPPVPYLVPGGNIYICDSSIITLSANTAGIANYQWYNNGNAIVDAVNNTYNATTQGTYNVVETDINGCIAVSDSVTVNVNALPNPVVVENGLTLSTTVPFQTYQWVLNGLPIQGATNSTYDAPVDGAYTVQISDANGCFGISAIQWVINVGVANISSGTAVNVYPNPNNGLFSLNGNMNTKDNKIQIQISDIAGKVVLTDKFDAKNGLINEQLSIDENMPSGMYMIRLVSDEQTIVLPFVKK